VYVRCRFCRRGPANQGSCGDRAPATRLMPDVRRVFHPASVTLARSRCNIAMDRRAAPRMRRSGTESAMMRSNVTTAFVTLSCALTIASGCSGTIGGDGQRTAADTQPPWSTVRAQRQQALDAYLTANHDDFMSFKNAALGNLGIPMVMFRLFPVLFPDIW